MLRGPADRCANPAFFGSFRGEDAAGPRNTTQSVRPITAGNGDQYVSYPGPDRLEEEIDMELIVTSLAATIVLLLGHFCIIIWNRLTGSR